jgi:hypothetical protein
MDDVRIILLGIVIGILGIIAVIYLLPVGVDAMAIARHGIKRIRRLDEADAEAGQVGKSGGRTGLAIGIGLGAFGLIILLLVIPMSAGVDFADTPLIVILRFLINLFTRPFGVVV